MQHPNREAFFRTRNWKLDEVNVMDEGTFWLVKSDDVQIQGRYMKNTSAANWTNLVSLALGGPFLEGNTFIIQTLSGKVTWNGEEILSHMGSEFSNNLISAKYHTDAEIVKDGHRGPGIEISLPHSVKLMVNRWKLGLAAKIQMCSVSGQDGQCGNFNGDHHDDVQGILMARLPSKKLAENEHLHGGAATNKHAWYSIGDRVKVRDADTDTWLMGTVTAVSPVLKVEPDYYDQSFPWTYVERAAN